MSNYTTSHLGGKAEAMLIVHSAQELETVMLTVWEMNLPYYLFGSGSNVFISGRGLHGVVILNRAHNVRIDTHPNMSLVWAESGAILSSTAKQAALRGLSGMEWAATVPGTVGGAVYGNAGAYGACISDHFVMAEILQPSGKETWSLEQMGYQYRSSILKREQRRAVILSARMKLVPGNPEEIQARIEELIARRRKSQPQEPSMGSVFKNPAGDHAARLIEAAGLKGARIGGAEISTTHANIFITHEGVTAEDYYQLILLAKNTVMEKFGVKLDLEVEMIGDWSEDK